MTIRNPYHHVLLATKISALARVIAGNSQRHSLKAHFIDSVPLHCRTLRSRASGGPRSSRRHEQSVSSQHQLRQQRLPAHDVKSSTNESTESTALVVIPADDRSVLGGIEGGAKALVSQPTLVVCRQIEHLNIFLGFEEANKYAIYNGNGELAGYIAEDSHTITSTMARNLAGTHRAFSCHVMSPDGTVVLKIKRGFAWINSHIQVFSVKDGEETLVGEVKQIWHLLRRKYELFLSRPQGLQQFGAIDEPTLSWDFSVMTSNNRLLGSINRNMRGLLRELFTDTGHYCLRMDSASPQTTNLSTSALAPQSEANEARAAIENTQSRALIEIQKQPMKLDERAVLLATAISIDFDYFSKLSGPGHGGIMPMPFFMPMGSSSPAPESTPGALPEAEVGAVNGLGATEGSNDQSVQDPYNDSTPADPYGDSVPSQAESNWWDNAPTDTQEQGQNWWDQPQSNGGEGDGSFFDGWDE